MRHNLPIKNNNMIVKCSILTLVVAAILAGNHAFANEMEIIIIHHSDNHSVVSAADKALPAKIDVGDLFGGDYPLGSSTHSLGLSLCNVGDVADNIFAFGLDGEKPYGGNYSARLNQHFSHY